MRHFSGFVVVLTTSHSGLAFVDFSCFYVRLLDVSLQAAEGDLEESKEKDRESEVFLT